MISKELLNAIFNDDVFEVVELSQNRIGYRHEVDKLDFGVGAYKEHKDGVVIAEKFLKTSEPINIHELAHKCKEWALSKDFCLSVVRDTDKELILFIGLSLDNEGIGYTEMFNGEDEVEMIFQACEWILNNKDE